VVSDAPDYADDKPLLTTNSSQRCCSYGVQHQHKRHQRIGAAYYLGRLVCCYIANVFIW
jgi:hypothetical protein